MMTSHSEIVQGSPEWHSIRLGKVTASRVSDLVAKTKTGWGASRANYMAELIAERLTGVPADTYTNAAMQWGTETEPLARSAYEFYSGQTVKQVGFVEHPSIAMCGASPDGLIGEYGLLEIKCPNTATHLDTLLSQDIAGKYITQMQFQMACSGRQWCDFASFDPRMPEPMRLFVQRIARDESLIEQLEASVIMFLAELDTKIGRLRNLYEKTAA